MAIWAIGSYMLIATHTVTQETPGKEYTIEGAVAGGAAGVAAGGVAGALIGGIGVAACGPGVGIPAGVVCFALAGMLGAGGAVTGGAIGSFVSSEGTKTTIEIPTYSQALSLIIIVIGIAATIYALWQVIKALREKKKQLQVVDI